MKNTSFKFKTYTIKQLYSILFIWIFILIFIPILNNGATSDTVNDSRSDICRGTKIDHVVINELYFYPLPKFVELYNPTNQKISIINWCIEHYESDGWIDIPDTVINPDEYIILCEVGDKEKVVEYWQINNSIQIMEVTELYPGRINYIYVWDTHTVIDKIPYLYSYYIAHNHSWSRYQGGYDSDNFTRDFYDEPDATPGRENNIIKSYYPNNMMLSCEEPESTIVGGENTTFNIVIRNTGNFSYTIDLQASYSSNKIIEKTYFDINQVTLEPGRYQVVTFTVYAIENSELTEFVAITVKIEAQSHPEITAKINLKVYPMAIKLSAEEKERTVLPSEIFNFNFTLAKCGPTIKNINLEAILSLNSVINVTHFNINPVSVKLVDTKTINLTVKIANNPSVGKIGEIKVKAISSETPSIYSNELIFKVYTVSLNVSCRDRELNISHGKTIVLWINVTNFGSLTDNIHLNVNCSSNNSFSNLSFENNSITLLPGEKQYVKLWVSAFENISSRTCTIKLVGISERDARAYSIYALIVHVLNLEPIVIIKSPENNSIISGQIVISGEAYDEEYKIELVQGRIYNESLNGTWQNFSGTDSWTYVWNTTTFLNGQYTIYARSYDGVYYSHIDFINVIVENPDFDNDSIPNTIDEDDDNDGVPDVNDTFPFNPIEWEDTDDDGIGDNADLDNDNDGYNDTVEKQVGTDPKDSSSVPADLDKDGIPDELDPDIDGDNVPNNDDDYNFDPNRWKNEESETNLLIAVSMVFIVVIIIIIVATIKKFKREKE